MGLRLQAQRRRRERPCLTAKSLFSYGAPSRNAGCAPVLKTPHSTSYSYTWRAPGALIRCQRDRGAGRLATNVAFPVVANLATLDELRRDWSDQHVVAMRAAYG